MRIITKTDINSHIKTNTNSNILKRTRIPTSILPVVRIADTVSNTSANTNTTTNTTCINTNSNPNTVLMSKLIIRLIRIGTNINTNGHFRVNSYTDAVLTLMF